MMRFHQLMQRLPDEIDCGVISSHVNRRYFTGFPSSAGHLLVTREKSYLLIDFRYYERAKREVHDCEVILQEHLYEQMKEIFQKHGCKTIAVEDNQITVKQFLLFKEKFPEYQWLESSVFSDLIQSLRDIKTPDEIYCILSVQEITEKAFEHILGCLRVGMTEKQVAYELDHFMRTHGADDIAFDTIAVSGTNASSPHGVPTDKPLEEGDFLTMDFGAKLNGYHSDMTRTVAIGEPSDEMIKLYQTVLEGQKIGLNTVRAGVSGASVDALVRNYFDEQGYPGAFGHSLGHGVGLEIHETPNLSPGYSNLLEPGMILTVEPGLYLPGKFGVRIEDMVVVTENGCKNLTKCKKDLIVVK